MVSLKLTPVLKQKLAELDQDLLAAYEKIAACSPDARVAIERFALISTIGASTRIENAQLTDAEVDWLDTVLTHDGSPVAFENHKIQIENKLSKDRERSIEEVVGCRKMLQLIYSQAEDFVPLSQTHLRALHQELMRYYQKAGPNVGRYKKQTNSVVEHNHQTGKTKTVFKTAEAGPITESAMTDLVSFYNQERLQEPYPLVLACEFVFRFLAIHPFQDGNGRLGRGLFALSLLQSKMGIIAKVAPYLAIDRHIEKERAGYYQVLNWCSDGEFSQDPKKYHIEHFVNFMIRILKNALLDIEVYLAKHKSTQELSKSAIKVLLCFKEHPEMRLTTRVIMEETSLARRTIISSLNKLVDAHLIQKYGKGAGVRYQLSC